MFKEQEVALTEARMNMEKLRAQSKALDDATSTNLLTKTSTPGCRRYKTSTELLSETRVNCVWLLKFVFRLKTMRD